MPPKQLSFLPAVSLQHGSDLRKGRRKIARPFDPRRPVHIVMRSTRARGQWSMLAPRNSKRVDNLVSTLSKKWGVKLLHYANVGNHLHILGLAPTRLDFKNFMREIAGSIAMIITGAKKGNGVGRFWDAPAFTRVVFWGRDLENLKLYFIKNWFESVCAITRAMRESGVQLISIGKWAEPRASQIFSKARNETND